MSVQTTPPLSPALHSAAVPPSASASPAERAPRLWLAKPAGLSLSPIATGSSVVFDDGAQLPTPCETGSAGGTFQAGLSSPKFHFSPRTSGSDGTPGFTPHYMGTEQPRAPELQWPSGSHAEQAQPKRPVWSPIAAVFGYQPGSTLAERTSAKEGRISLDSPPQHDGSSTTSRLKRSLSALLQRSSSVLRRGEPGWRSPQRAGTARRGHSAQSSVSASRAFRRSASPTPPPTAGVAPTPHSAPGMFTASSIAGALGASQFNVSPASKVVSPLIGNSTVHVKVIMDEDTVVVVPMLLTLVFAKARERILTKLFRGGVPLVESKRRTLAVRQADGTMAPIMDNPTWRALMDVAARARCQQPRVTSPHAAWPVAPQPCARSVVKLTLFLMCPAAA
ncbi:hypothetical protein H4R21_002641 [Coemansia helicoidea]|uniref:Uncharacterized protein n=1 Tax=Coemansia helicoidea TaxID=1286919 RepID=A0ACC1L7A6_9FUNG|nr:hypothetical protein H4R21_002641 [Coemansia helicoidea]